MTFFRCLAGKPLDVIVGRVLGEAVLLRDLYDRQIRFSMERQQHIERDHPEMIARLEKIKETLLSPDQILQSHTDDAVELFSRDYESTPVDAEKIVRSG
jgi:hypothetical protein